jgi:hypothetical protein
MSERKPRRTLSIISTVLSLVAIAISAVTLFNLNSSPSQKDVYSAQLNRPRASFVIRGGMEPHLWSFFPGKEYEIVANPALPTPSGFDLVAVKRLGNELQANAEIWSPLPELKHLPVGTKFTVADGEDDFSAAIRVNGEAVFQKYSKKYQKDADKRCYFERQGFVCEYNIRVNTGG